jgi:hypothetical protein
MAFLAGTLERPGPSSAVPGPDRSRGHALDGKARMDEVRTTVAAMRTEVESKLRDSWREFDATLAASRRTAMLSLGTAGALSLALVAMLVHYASRRRLAEDAAAAPRRCCARRSTTSCRAWS